MLTLFCFRTGRIPSRLETGKSFRRLGPKQEQKILNLQEQFNERRKNQDWKMKEMKKMILITTYRDINTILKANRYSLLPDTMESFRNAKLRKSIAR